MESGGRLLCLDRWRSSKSEKMKVKVYSFEKGGFVDSDPGRYPVAALASRRLISGVKLGRWRHGGTPCLTRVSSISPPSYTCCITCLLTGVGLVEFFWASSLGFKFSLVWAFGFL